MGQAIRFNQIKDIEYERLGEDLECALGAQLANILINIFDRPFGK